MSAHGTYAGWNVHQKAKETACDPCREARTAYVKEWRRKTGRTTTTLQPVNALEQAEAKLHAVRALHRSGALPYTLARDQTCMECGHTWPCPTTKVLEGNA